jgi:hypothetical protein
MIKILRSSGRLSRAQLALVVSVVFNVVLGVFSGIVYTKAPSSPLARLLDDLGAPAERMTYWLAPGHTGLQPVLVMLISVIFSWVVIWTALSLPSWWSKRL